MAKGSQLTQLKAALKDAGLSKKAEAKSGKKRKRASAPQEKDKEKAAEKLREIHEKLNPFDMKVTKLKHDVGGRKLKGVTGRPGLSKQAGLEHRKQTLLPEIEKKGHVGGVIDRRFGENDSTLTSEERMLERFTRERQRASKNSVFNLDDEEELTHYGQSLSAMDDFDGAALGLNDEDDEDAGQIDPATVSRTHFGGFEDEEDPDAVRSLPPRKKSKAEVMAEVMAKSKEYKYLRQQEKEAVDNARVEVDQDFESIRSLIYQDTTAMATASIKASEDVKSAGAPTPSLGGVLPIAKGDDEYDQLVRELAFERRAKPKDRTKTEEELALDEKAALEKAERARLRRMMGEVDDSDEEDGRKGRKRKRERGADDLDDDFMDENDFAGLGAGLGGAPLQSDEDEDGKGEGEDEESEMEGESDEEGSEEDDDSVSDVSEADGDVEGTVHVPLVSSRRKEKSKKGKAAFADDEIPFTFSCPETHDEFLEIMEGIDDKHTSTIVQRIRALYHPSLSKDNTQKLQTFLGVLLDHVLHLASPPTPRFSVVEALVPHIHALTKTYPVVSAQTCVAKLTLMHKNLVRGLSQGAISPSSRTWPGSAELAFLRVMGILWSTSDMNHAVISATRILMGAYLGLGRIRSSTDIASGLFLCTLFLQYEEFSKRLVPEVINFLLNAVLHLTPHSFKNADSVPGSLPLPDFNEENVKKLRLTRKAVKGLQCTRPDLPALLSGDQPKRAQAHLNLLATGLQLLGKFADSYKSLDAFIELYSPVLEVLNGLALEGFPETLTRQLSTLQGTTSRLLKFANQSRKPLRLQAHKPIAIPSYVPKFGSTTSNYLRYQDPDHERAQLSKLRNQVKQERKGAIRELRKDARFLASVQQKKDIEASQAYNDRMKKVFSSLEGERAEQKAMDREKARDKKRGKK
ncbi:hypothetical protein M422DRAFT_150207 [Sphaerobolus stellatus SS14]|nr:hypothetical protein M422DRAFT_150207 [Sphaerobolus stellatus SS14]